MFHGNQTFVYNGTGVVHIDTDASQTKVKEKGKTGSAYLPKRTTIRQKPHTELDTIKTGITSEEVKW